MIPDVLKGHGAFIFRASIILGLFNPEDEGTMILQNIRNNLPKDTRRLESIASPLGEPQIF
jgi:hypothetical protein